MIELDAYPDVSKKARIEIIPLIDVIFFLLATFVLFTLSLEKIGAIGVPLPKVPIAPPAEVAMVYLQVSEPGTYFWKEGGEAAPELVTTAQLRPRLEAYRQRAAAPRVLIRGDGRAKFGDTVRALDEVRLAGIEQVSVETLVSKTGN